MTIHITETVRQGDAEIIANRLSEQLLDAAMEVHRTLGGSGVLESLYEDALFHELRLHNIPAKNFKLPVSTV